MESVKFDFSGTFDNEKAMARILSISREQINAYVSTHGKHNLQDLLRYVDLLEKTISRTYSRRTGLGFVRRGKLYEWQRSREGKSIWDFPEAD